MYYNLISKLIPVLALIFSLFLMKETFLTKESASNRSTNKQEIFNEKLQVNADSTLTMNR